MKNTGRLSGVTDRRLISEAPRTARRGEEDKKDGWNMTLRELEIGRSGKVTSVGGQGALRQHFLDMGVIPGAVITVVKYAPMGDPVELMIHGYQLTLRLDDAARIEIEPVAEENGQKEPENPAIRHNHKSPHPGFGEGGKYHPKGSGNPLPEGFR